MSNATSAILACEDVQRELYNYFMVCSPDTHQRRSPFLEMLQSDANRSGISLEVAPGGAKVKTVVMRYDQKVPVADVTEVTECGLDCSVDNTVGDKSASYTIDPCVKVKYGESYSFTDFQYMCRTNEDYVNKRLLLMANAIEEKVAAKSASEAILLQGNWASDVTTTGDVLRIGTRLSGGLNLNANWMPEFDFATMQTAYCAGIGVFGAAEFYKAARLMNSGCCTSAGIDLASVLANYGKAFEWDPYITAAFGDPSYSLVTQLGAMQLLTYTVGTAPEFRGFVNRGTNFEIIPLVTPRYGIPVDLVVSNDCGNLSLIMTTSTKVVAAPLDMFPTSDVLSGVNYVNYAQAYTLS